MDRRWVGVAAGMAILLLVVTAGLTGGSPTEGMTVCLDCVPEHEANVTVEDSVTHLYLQESGDARVVARSEVSGPGVENLRDDERLREYREGVVRRHESRITYGLDPHPRTDYEARMDGDTFVVSYRYVNFTERRGGVSFSDGYVWPRQWGFRDDRSIDVETDRLVVHPPDGTSPLVVPPGARAEGDALVWNDGVSARGYMAFGDGGGALRVRTLVALDVLAWAGPAAARTAAFPVVVLTGLAVAFTRYDPRRRGVGRDGRLTDDAATVGLGTLGVALSFTLFGQLTVSAVHPGALPGPLYDLYSHVPLVPYVGRPTDLAAIGAFTLGALFVADHLHGREDTDGRDRGAGPLFWVTVAVPLVAVPFRLIAGSGSGAFDPAVPVLWAGTPWGSVWAAATVLGLAVVSVVAAGYLLFVLTGPDRRDHIDDPLFLAVAGVLVLATAFGILDAARLVAVDGDRVARVAPRAALLLTSSVGLALLYPGRPWAGRDTDAGPGSDTDARDGTGTGTHADTAGAGTDAATHTDDGRSVAPNGGAGASRATTLTGTVPILVAVALGTAALTGLLALDYTASFAGSVGTLCLLGLVCAFPVLALFVGDPDRTHHRTALVAAVPGLAWSYRFSVLVVEGTYPHGPQPVVTPWTVLAPAVAVIGFYVVYRWR